MSMTSRRIMKRTTALLLSATMVFSLLALLPSGKKVSAEWTKDASNTFLGSSVITRPSTPSTPERSWSGNYVYYAKYDDTPIRFRVLDPNCNKYGEPTMLLDCDSVLFSTAFNSNSGSLGTSRWLHASVRSWINQAMFLMYYNCFTSTESLALLKTEMDSYSYPESVDSAIRAINPESTPLYGDKIFLLDVEDLTNPNYGYYPDYSVKSNARYKKLDGEYHSWLSRSKYDDSSVFMVKSDATFGNIEKSKTCGISPAMNVQKDSIVFSTLVYGMEGKMNAEYKLTVLSPRELKLQEGKTVTVNSSKISVPYSYEYAANGIYAVITDKEYTENGAKILHYIACDKVSGPDDYRGEGVVSFSVPDDLDKTGWGKDYHVYITAEMRNGKYETDYCSNLVELERSMVGLKKTIDLRDDPFAVDLVTALSLALFSSNNYIQMEVKDSISYIDLDKDGTNDVFIDNSVSPSVLRRLPESNLVGDIYVGDYTIEYLFRFPDCKIPGAATDLTAKAGGKNRVVLSWNAVEGADGYLIYAQKDGKYGYVGMTGGTSFPDIKALDWDYNFYWVFPYAKDSRDKMYPGSCPKYVYAKGVCAPVTNLKASSVNGGVKLTWTASYQAEGYLVYGIVDGKPYGYIGMTTKGTEFVDKTASKTVYNYYWVYPYHKDADGKMIVGLTGKYTYGRAK